MTSTTAPALPDSPAELLRAVKATRDRAAADDVEMMRLAVHWADLHIADPEFAEACFTSPKTFAGEGSPSIDEFCVPEFATMLGRTNDSAGRFLTDCVEVAYRLPRLWGAVLSGLVAGWRARIIAQTTLALSLEAATHVDEQVFWCASRLTPSQLRRVVDEARVRFMPDAVQKALEDSADKRHVTFDTEQASFDGTMHLEADLEIPDALALAEAVSSGAEHLAKLGSTDTADGRRATALGDLARHQMTIGFNDEDENNAAGGEVRPQRRVKPATQIHLYAHLSADAITHFDNPDAPDEALCGRIEQGGNRLLSVDQIRAWCGRPDVQVVVTQVIDLRERWSARATGRPRRSGSTSSSATGRVSSRGVAATRGSATWTTSSRTTTTTPSRAVRRRPTTSPRSAGDTTGSRPGAVAVRDDRTRGLRLDQPPRQHLPPRPHRQPTDRTRLARNRDPVPSRRHRRTGSGRPSRTAHPPDL